MIVSFDSLGSVADLVHGERWSGDDLAAAAIARAAMLRSAGIGAGDKVLIVQPGSGGFFANLFAVWTAGATAAVLNSALTKEEFGNIESHLKPAVVLNDGEGVSAVENCKTGIWNFSRELTPDLDARQAPREATLDDAALILFTSGTTGVPKGVVHTFRSLLARLALNSAYIGAEDIATTLCTLPVHFGHGLIGNCLTALLHGGDLILDKGTDIKAIGKLGDTIDENGVSFMSSVPAFWRLALKFSAPPKKAALKRVHVGSAPMSADLWRQIMDWSGIDNVVNMYGITETANWIGGASAAEFEPEDGLIGRLWGGYAALMAEDGSFKHEGEGELLIQTPSIMSSYFELPEMTAQSFVNGWFRTGDLGRVKDGVIVLTGRKKNEINRAGIKVQPEDIDVLLERHPDVIEACAFGRPDRLSGETVCVALALEPEHDLKQIQKWCAERLVREKLPDKWFVLDEIPKTDRGKVRRDHVAAVCLGQAGDKKVV